VSIVNFAAQGTRSWTMVTGTAPLRYRAYRTPQDIADEGLFRWIARPAETLDGAIAEFACFESRVR
jgi:hypothetical protein